MSSGAAGDEPDSGSPLAERKPEETHTDGRLQVRAARLADAPAVARILVEAFPSLYRSTFGNLGTEGLADLLAHLYLAGNLSLVTTHVAERDGQVVGLAILHVGESIGRGSMWAYGLLLLRHLSLFRAVRAFFGGLSANAMLDRRIPRAPDLAYIEALAVAEDKRGRGVGTRLLETAMAWAQAQGRSHLALHVLRSNTGAQRLYERMGFRTWNPRAARASSASPFARRAHAWSTLLMVVTLQEQTPR